MLSIKNFLLLIIIFLLMGCSNLRTRDAYKEPLLQNAQHRNFSGAIRIIEEAEEKSFTEKDKVLYHLYLGILFHYDKNYNASIYHLNQAEDLIDELYTKSISRAASSILLNDNTLAYSGEDYEDIYINIFKALNFINMKDIDAAFVEIRKVNIKLNLLEDKYKEYANKLNSSDDSKIEVSVKSTQFNNSALARYLSMLLYRAENSMDDARIDKEYIEEAFRLQSHIYYFSPPDLSTFEPTRSNEANLTFVSFIGLAPEKYPITYRVATLEDMIIVFSDNGSQANGQHFPFPGVSPGYYFKFAIPQIREKKSEINRISIEVNGRSFGTLEKIEDVNKIAKETFEVKANMAYVRAITRTVVKGIASILAQKEIEKRTGELGGLLAKFGTAAITEASEAADLRSCSIFPGFAYVGDYQIDPGIYDIRVVYHNKNGMVDYVEEIPQYEVKRNNLNLIESYYLK